jgi:hypothetical protein
VLHDVGNFIVGKSEVNRDEYATRSTHPVESSEKTSSVVAHDGDATTNRHSNFIEVGAKTMGTVLELSVGKGTKGLSYLIGLINDGQAIGIDPRSTVKKIRDQ